ncbi:Hypothetical protein UVM_LOCUS229 [uncultured virus]|nr:Hypothetical protein UVM_LOCUS229 [uncultured virus]
MHSLAATPSLCGATALDILSEASSERTIDNDIMSSWISYLFGGNKTAAPLPVVAACPVQAEGNAPTDEVVVASAAPSPTAPELIVFARSEEAEGSDPSAIRSRLVVYCDRNGIPRHVQLCDGAAEPGLLLSHEGHGTLSPNIVATGTGTSACLLGEFSGALFACSSLKLPAAFVSRPPPLDPAL